MATPEKKKNVTNLLCPHGPVRESRADQIQDGQKEELNIVGINKVEQNTAGNSTKSAALKTVDRSFGKIICIRIKRGYALPLSLCWQNRQISRVTQISKLVSL